MIPEQDFYGRYFSKAGELQGGNFGGGGGASSLTRKQLRSYAIDSQALFLHLRAVAAGVGLQ
ncbi:hypothetical protein B6D51_22940 [Pseudomonas chlororaphis subsp. chlororaphis]|nr:hypothetical protein B6D51_22940 [Pseudomonas chlororaphis subsp. chlororaphis]